MNSLDLINELYKPYRIIKKSKCTIIESTSGKFVIKPKGKQNIKELFSYLASRGFYGYPNLVDETRSDIDLFEFVEDINYPLDQKATDLIKVVAELHLATHYYKEVREDKFKEIYEQLKNNCLYYKNKYNEIVQKIEEEVFMSPSHYLFIRNSSKLLNQIAFCEKKLDDWYDKVKDKREIRVAVVHNNLKLEHFLKGNKEVLISWDDYVYDTPIKDVYNLYKNEFFNVEFGSLLGTYLKHFPLEDEELELLLIMICMPEEIELSGDEFKSTERVGRIIDYVFKTEALARPYYLVNDEK